ECGPVTGRLGSGDGGERTLERTHNPTVLLLKVARVRTGGECFVDECGPTVTSVDAQPFQLRTDVELARTNRVSDCEGAGYARVVVVVFPVGELGESTGGIDEFGCASVVEVAEGERPGAHERSVAGAAASAAMHPLGDHSGVLLGVVVVEGAEHGA